MKKTKRFFAVLLAIALALSVIPQNAFAADVTIPGTEIQDDLTVDTVTCGDTLLTGTGIVGSTIKITFADGTQEDTHVAGDGTWALAVPSGVSVSCNEDIKVEQKVPIDLVPILYLESIENISKPGISYATAGDTLEYTWTLGNEGDEYSVLDAEFTIELPAAVTFNGVQLGGMDITNTAYADFDSVTHTLTVYVGAILCGGSEEITFTVTVSGDITGLDGIIMTAGLNSCSEDGFYEFEGYTFTAGETGETANKRETTVEGEHTVTFDSKGGTVVSPIKTNCGITINAPSNPTKDGFEFNGWYTNETYATAWNFENDLVEGDVTLYAQWGEISAGTYTVTYSPNGGDGTAYDVTENVRDGHEVLANSDSNLGFARTGYVFLGWSTDSSAGTADVAAGAAIGDEAQNGDTITLYAVWAEIQLNVNPMVCYIANGGTGGYDDTDIPYGSEYTVLGMAEANVSRDGYKFTGWNTQSNGNGTAYAAGYTFDITEDLYLWAQWEENPETPDAYNAGYTFESGTDGKTLPKAVTDLLPSDANDYADGTTVTAETLTTTEVTVNGGKWTFQGWDANKKTISGDDVIFNGTWTFTADTPASPTYAVDYDANGGSGSHADTGLTSGSDYVILGQPATGITRDGYTFKGWNTKADGSGTSYAPGDTITITEDLTLYAQWEKTSSGSTTSNTTNNTTGKTTGSSGTTSSPKTGDTSNMTLWITLLFASLAGVIYLLVAARRRKPYRTKH